MHSCTVLTDKPLTNIIRLRQKLQQTFPGDLPQTKQSEGEEKRNRVFIFKLVSKRIVPKPPQTLDLQDAEG